MGKKSDIIKYFDCLQNSRLDGFDLLKQSILPNDKKKIIANKIKNSSLKTTKIIKRKIIMAMSIVFHKDVPDEIISY